MYESLAVDSGNLRLNWRHTNSVNETERIGLYNLCVSLVHALPFICDENLSASRGFVRRMRACRIESLNWAWTTDDNAHIGFAHVDDTKHHVAEVGKGTQVEDVRVHARRISRKSGDATDQTMTLRIRRSVTSFRFYSEYRKVEG